MVPQVAPQAARQPPQQPPVTIDAVMELLRDGMTRRFRIDIETDSTVTGDESQERQDRTAFIDSTTKFVQAWGPIIAANPLMVQLAGELLLFGTRAFRVGRSLEEVIEETVDKLEFQASQPKPPPQPSPDEMVKMQTAQVKGQAEITKARTDAATSAQDAMFKHQEMKLDMAGKVMDHQIKSEQHQMDMERMGAETALGAQALENQAEAQQHGHNLKMEQMDHAAKVAKQNPKDGK